MSETSINSWKFLESSSFKLFKKKNASGLLFIKIKISEILSSFSWTLLNIFKFILDNSFKYWLISLALKFLERRFSFINCKLSVKFVLKAILHFKNNSIPFIILNISFFLEHIFKLFTISSKFIFSDLIFK